MIRGALGIGLQLAAQPQDLYVDAEDHEMWSADLELPQRSLSLRGRIDAHIVLLKIGPYQLVHRHVLVDEENPDRALAFDGFAVKSEFLRAAGGEPRGVAIHLAASAYGGAGFIGDVLSCARCWAPLEDCGDCRTIAVLSSSASVSPTDRK